jgi:streptogramin lyase
MRTLSSPVLYRAALSVLAGLLSIPTVAQSSIGSGPAFVTPWAIAVEATSTLVVVDSGLHTVARVDPVSGDRTVVSDAMNGSGPALSFPAAIAVEASGSLVVSDAGLKAVMRVNPVTGDRTVVSF